MAHLVKYAQLSLMTNSIAGNLVKAQCDFCGRKFGSMEEAEECERNHIKSHIRKELQDELKKSIERAKI